MKNKNDEFGSFHLISKGTGFTNNGNILNPAGFADIFQDSISKRDLDNLKILFQDDVSDKVLEKLLGRFPAIFKQEQKRLLEDYGYAAERGSEMNATLYLKLKAAFLSKKLPEKMFVENEY